MGDRVNSASLTLTNSGSIERTYRIELIDIVYDDDGGITISDDVPDGYPTARPFLRFSPSLVRLQSGESQRIRVIARTRSVRDGEYRAHARIISVASPDNLGASPGQSATAGVFSISHAIALPVIVRRGKTSAAGDIDAVRFAQGRREVNAVLTRSGNQSLYVDLRLVRVDQENQVVNIMRGIAVPVPNGERRVTMTLPETAPAGEYSLEVIDNATGETIATSPVR